jgi:hypothetical protein
MRIWLPLVLVLVSATAAAAHDTGNAPPPKAMTIGAPNIPGSNRQGGDTIATALPIPGLPFNDTGTTAGYGGDYDEECPWDNSDAPDVVYSYATSVPVHITIDLCGSEYDTKTYVYDSALNVVACNDDFYMDELCGRYVSKLENLLLVPDRYYIMVDGYSDDQYGNYVLEVTVYEPCDIPCPAGAVAEGEPPLADEYVDLHNGGCSTNPGAPVFQQIFGQADGTSVLCGVAGWYSYQGGNLRDTDWFLLTTGPGGEIHIEAQAEQTTAFFELGPQDCAAVDVVQSATAFACDQATMTITGYDPGQVVWFWAGPAVFIPPDGGDNEYDYVVRFSGLEPTVATESTTWGRVKALCQ